MNYGKRDNDSFPQKVSLRKTALDKMEKEGIEPIILEAFGGFGDIYETLYHPYTAGVVLEKDPIKAHHLARQRPSWSVYQADCETALALGAGKHMVFTLADFDAYGDVWPAVNAFFRSDRPFAERMFVVANDGLRWLAGNGGAWKSGTLAPLVQEGWGNNLYTEYLGVSEELLRRAVGPAGYTIDFFDGYYAGTGGKLCHWLAIVNR